MITTTGDPVRAMRSAGRRVCHWVLLAVLSGPALAQTSTARFQILRGEDVLGEVHATKLESPGHIRYSMTSRSEFSLIWKQEVRTRVSTEYRNGAIAQCHSAVVVNDEVRDSSHMAHGADRCYVHPDLPFTCERSTQWTTARMYFEEPVGQDRIFVESLLRDLTLEPSGAGRYTLVFPNGTRNHYQYMAGRLQEIHVERSFFGLVFRRV